MLKGEIVLSLLYFLELLFIIIDPSLKIEITGKGKWQISTPTRHYYFKVLVFFEIFLGYW